MKLPPLRQSTLLYCGPSNQSRSCATWSFRKTWVYIRMGQCSIFHALPLSRASLFCTKFVSTLARPFLTRTPFLHHFSSEIHVTHSILSSSLHYFSPFRFLNPILLKCSLMDLKLICIAIRRRPDLEDISIRLHLSLKRRLTDSRAHPNLHSSSHYFADRIGYLVPLVA